MKKEMSILFVLFTLVATIVFSSFSLAQNPEGPSSITHVSNSTRGAAAAIIRNESEGGGYIFEVNITALQTNTRWKAYVGNISGSLVLADSTGARVYDWTLSTTFSGEVYATRNDTTIAWASIACANDTVLVDEDDNLNHTNAGDNISTTFDGTTHAEFIVGSTTFAANACPTTNTYQNNISQDVEFEEMVLWDGQSHNATSSGNGSVVFATIIENDTIGYRGRSYDFQILLPEDGSPSWTSSTAYYFYIELT